MIVPKDFLDSARRTFGPPGSRWCARLPDIVAEYVETSHLEIDLRDDEDCWFGMCGIVVPVRTANGESAVLKVSWVDGETGDLEFGALPTVWNRLDELEPADQPAALLRRTGQFSEVAGLDIDRVRAWSVAVR